MEGEHGTERHDDRCKRRCATAASPVPPAPWGGLRSGGRASDAVSRIPSVELAQPPLELACASPL